MPRACVSFALDKSSGVIFAWIIAATAVEPVGDQHGVENGVFKQSKNVYQSAFVFDSRFNYPELKSQTKYPVLQQHFIGWFVETEEDVFDELTPKFMDFTVEQRGNTRFMYVLPFSKNKALVEYTLFSAEPLAKKEYEDEIMS